MPVPIEGIDDDLNIHLGAGACVDVIKQWFRF